MKDLNRIQITGRLGAEPQLKKTPQGYELCKISIATHIVKKAGEEETQWHRVSLWGKTALWAAQHLKKGHRVFVEGSLRIQTYTDAQNQPRQSVEILADRVDWMERATESESTATEASAPEISSSAEPNPPSELPEAELAA